MTQRRIIIGDVHGHYDALLSLIDRVALQEDDRVYFLGDLIDRGPKSAQVVQFVMDNNYPCLLGNHEAMLLDVVMGSGASLEIYQGWLQSGGYATVESYQNRIPPEHIEWMKQLPLYMDLGDLWLVHAGVDPTMSLEKQSSDQFCWIRADFHSIEKPYFHDKLIITGHTITFTLEGVNPGQVASGAGWIDIDTGAYHPRSGWLTAFDADNKTVYQVNTQTLDARILPFNEIVAPVDRKQIIARNKRKIWAR
jgi:serine/threonine protein phosphatase 1